VKLPAAVYTAYKGYAWSQIPTGIEPSELEALLRLVSNARGDFPDPLSVDSGIVSNGRVAAVFTWQNVAGWDSNGRAADYGAFIFFPVGLSRLFNFVSLISQDFFWTPSHTPPAAVDYAGPAATEPPADALDALRAGRPCHLADPAAVGTLLTAHGAKSSRWTCLMQSDGRMLVTCDKWKSQKEYPL